MMEKTIRNQDGMVLVLVLIVLVAVIIIGVTAMRSSTLETRIAGNDKQQKQDFYQAEGYAALAMAASTSWIGNPPSQYMPPDMPPGMSNSPLTISLKAIKRPPAGTGYSVSLLKAYYYDILSTENNQQIKIGVWKAFPDPDGG